MTHTSRYFTNISSIATWNKRCFHGSSVVFKPGFELIKQLERIFFFFSWVLQCIQEPIPHHSPCSHITYVMVRCSGHLGSQDTDFSRHHIKIRCDSIITMPPCCGLLASQVLLAGSSALRSSPLATKPIKIALSGICFLGPPLLLILYQLNPDRRQSS